MAIEHVDELRVRLGRIEELFAEPETDPFDPDSRYRTGLEELLEQMHGLRGKEMQVVIELPPDTVETGVQEKAKAALGRYCRAKIDELERLLKDHWHLARHQLVTALIVLLGFFLVAALVVMSEKVTGVIEALAVFGLGVFGYTALWGPADLILYAWRPYQQGLGRHRRLLEAELVIRARD